jgi:hypothetical protein
MTFAQSAVFARDVPAARPSRDARIVDDRWRDGDKAATTHADGAA